MNAVECNSKEDKVKGPAIGEPIASSTNKKSKHYSVKGAPAGPKTHLEPAHPGILRRPKPIAPRPGSKTAKILLLLRRPQGASLRDLLKATGWQPHSVRGFLSGTVAGKLGLRILSSKTESGERRYAVKA